MCGVYDLQEDFEMWIAQDIHLLRLVAHKIAYKLYRSSYNRGARLFYPPTFLFLDYMLKFASTHNIEKKGEVILRKTREGIREELGMTVKTINRTITKLKEDGLIDTRKGKVVMSLEQYRMARDKIDIMYREKMIMEKIFLRSTKLHALHMERKIRNIFCSSRLTNHTHRCWISRSGL